MTGTSYGPGNGQFLRKASLVVSSSTGSQLLEITDEQLRFRFEVQASDVETPNAMTVRIYNLADSTRKTLIKEFDTIRLEAGYQYGNFGQIFTGNIKQYRYGKERNVDSYLDIMAGDGDLGYNFGVVNSTSSAEALASARARTSTLVIRRVHR